MVARKRFTGKIPKQQKPINRAKSKKPRQPLWNPLLGITQTGLTQFVGNEEEFAVNYVEGWSPNKFREALEFGNLFHLCCEFQGKDSPEMIAKKCCDAYVKSRKINNNDREYQKLQEMVGVIRTLFPLYVKKYAAYDKQIRWISREKPFSVPYQFKDYDGKTRTINLVGKRDGVYRDSSGSLNLFETKTKSDINTEAIRDGLRADFQTLFYLLALKLETGTGPKQVLYNVVRRPGQKFGKKDTFKTFLDRVEKDIRSRPKHYYGRWRVTLSPNTLTAFQQLTLDPALRRLVRWWESIKDNPFDRFQSPYHLLNLPALIGGKWGRSEYYELIIRHNYTPYHSRSIVFPELSELIEVT